jgi:PAS domain S-box-containing protein
MQPPIQPPNPELEALTRAEHRFRAAVEAVSGFVWDWDFEQNSLTRSRPEFPLFGYTRDEVPDGFDWWQQRVHPDDLAPALAAVREAEKTMQPKVVLRYRFRCKDGHFALVEDHAALEYRDGKLVRAVGCMQDVTEREAARIEAEALETRYRVATGLYDALIWDWDIESNVETRTRPDTPFLGYDQSDIQNATSWWQTLVHPDDVDRVVKSVYEAMAIGKQRLTQTYRFRRKDNTYATVEDRVQILYRDAKPIRVVACLRDISDSLAAEAAVRESEGRFRSLLEATPALIWAARPDWTIVYFTPNYVRWSGYTPEEFNAIHEITASGTRDSVCHPDDLDELHRHWERFMREGGNFHCEFRYRRKGGDYRWVACSATGRKADSVPNEFYVGTLTDIHDQRTANTALLEQAQEANQSLKWIEFVLNAVPTPIMLVSRERQPLFANNAFRTNIRLLSDAQDLSVLYSLQAFDATGNLLSEGEYPVDDVLRGNRVSGREITYVGPTGRTTALVHGEVLPAIYGREEAALMVYQPVDELKKIERELRDAVEAKDRFLAVLSHELRTPLTPVLSLAQMLEQDPLTPDSIRETAAIIRRNVELETRLIDDLLDLTRISRGKLRLDFKPIDLRDPIRNVLDICHAELRSKSIDTVLTLPDTPLPVRADSARLHQVFWNLVKNSIKFTNPGGRIDISATSENNQLTVRVRDNGMGIPANLLPRVFDAFMQGDHDVRHHGGLGLGLAIARALVEMHGGQLTASSAGPGRGAEFLARLPLMAQATHDHPAQPTSETQRCKPLTILLVEDHADTARVMARLLRKLGHTVKTTDTVAAAIQTLRSETFDLLISDIGLPDGSGYDIMRATAGNRPPAIAVSGFGMDDDMQRSLEAGFLEHLTKPIDANLLESTIQRAVEK